MISTNFDPKPETPRPRRLRRPRADRALRIAAALSTLEDRLLLAANGPYLFPSPPTVDSVDKVLYDGVTGALQKTLTITNNSPDQYLYAFLEGEISRQAIAPYQGTGGFDPYDFVDHEYRGYVGHTDGTHDYAGLPPLTSITITVPLAFWDSGRIVFSTDGVDQFATYGGPDGGSPVGAPFYYLDANTQAKYFAHIDAGRLDALQFSPIYNGFDPSNGGMPTTANWKSPVTSGVFQDGETLLVTGPGLPSGGFQVVVDASNPNWLQLPGSATAAQTTQEYIFSALPGRTISPTDRHIEGGFSLTAQGAAPTSDGLVMWYHALYSQSPNNDAPFQLTEVSYRGTFYDPTVNVGTGFQYLLGSVDFPGAKLDSVDYDISFVDTINMPVAMEARDVGIPNTGVSAPFGWVGSSQALDKFQAAISAFTSTNPQGLNQNFLGTYFDGRGYPSYVQVAPGDLKLPSGQNLFLASPAVGGVADIQYYKKFSDSVIQSPLYALTSGGDGPSSFLIGGSPAFPSQGGNLALSTGTEANRYLLEQLIAPNVAAGRRYRVTYDGDTKTAGNVVGMYYAPDGHTIVGVVLDRDVPPDAADQVYQFRLPATDYAASRIAGLWYSWAKYYADNAVSTPLNGVSGTIASDNVLTLAAPTPGLVPGMGVTGVGVPAGCIVLSVSADQRTLHLSVGVNAGSTTFNFSAPSFGAISGFDSNPAGNTPSIPLAFSAAEQPYALAFARTIFVVMSSWSASVPSNAPNGWNSLLVNIIGGNLGANYLPDANADVVNTLTILSKSALRGVPDFTNPLYSDSARWYPDPAFPTGGQTYNVYNLDPFVWFIHKKLGLTAYAFSLDDDIGNVDAGGATHLDVAVGGLGGLSNRDPYTNESPWGVLTSTAADPPANSSVLGGLQTPQIVYQIAQFDYAHDTPGTLINGPGVAMGTTAQFTQIAQDLPQSLIVLSNPLSGPSGGATYAFFGPLNFTGTVLGVGQATDTILLDAPDAFDTLSKLVLLANLRVTGEGIAIGKTVAIKGISRDASGVVALQLTQSLDPTLVSQPGGFYAYTIGSPVVGVIRDPGFEWADVQALAGGFNHGGQLTENTVDWTFVDSPTHSKDWLAGIVFNGGVYAQGNPLARQGLQVAFVQGDASLAQTITVGAGSYRLTGWTARSGAFSTPQPLTVLVDGNPLPETIAPQGVDYETFSLPITLTAGTHTITFVGTAPNDGATLLDALALTTGLTLPEPPRPPALAAIPDASVNEGATLAFTAVATGSAEPLTFSLDPGAPQGAAVDPRTGAFAWRPTTPGRYEITIRVTDANSPSRTAARTFLVTVANLAPVVSLDPVGPIPTAEFRDGGSIVDAGSGPLTATVDYGDGTGPQPLTLGSGGDFNLAHAYTRPGTFTIVVSARDPFGGLGTATLTLTATAAPLVSGFGRGRDAFLTEFYLATFGRLPEPSALRFWARRLAAGTEAKSAARAIWGSAERQRLLRTGQVAPIPFRRALSDALRRADRVVRLHQPPPAGPLSLRVGAVSASRTR